MKPFLGPTIYTRLLVHRVYNLDPRPKIVVIDDLGFEIEEIHTRPNVVIRVQRTGCTFTNDSRKYITTPRFTIDNNGTLTDLREKAKGLVTLIVRNFLEPLQEKKL